MSGRISTDSIVRSIARAVGRGVFPHRFSALLELPVRRLLLSPEELASRLLLRSGDRVLEIGAGSGYYSRAIAARCGELVLLDVQTQMLQKARARLGDLVRDRRRVVCADAASLPFRRASFDVVCMVAVFGEVSHSNEMVAEVHRILKPDGLLSISEHLPDPDFSSFSRLKPILCRAGFESERRYGPLWAYTALFKKVTS